MIIFCSDTTRPQVNHDVLVSVEEHDGARVVQLVHRVEVGHLCRVDEVDDAVVLDELRNRVQHLVHLHADGVVVVPEPDADDARLLR